MLGVCFAEVESGRAGLKVPVAATFTVTVEGTLDKMLLVGKSTTTKCSRPEKKAPVSKPNSWVLPNLSVVG